MLEIQVGLRIKLDRDYDLNMSNVILKKGMIVTVRSIIESEGIVLVQYGFNIEKNQPLIVGISIDKIIEVTEEELSFINYIDLIPTKWHLGNKIAVDEKNKIYELAVVQLKPLELDDVYTLIPIDKPNESHFHSRGYLEQYGMLIDSTLTENLFKESETIEESGELTEENKEKTTEDIIELNINGFKFILEIYEDENKIITSAEINENNIADYCNAINKIKKIIKWR
jgi:hypothetical protein